MTVMLKQFRFNRLGLWNAENPDDDPGGGGGGGGGSTSGNNGTTLTPGLNVWTRVQVRRGNFLRTGAAGGLGHTWADINSFRVELVNSSPTDVVTLALDALYLYGGSGLDVTAGVGYDYRITWYNANTGAESAPSPTMIAANWKFPHRSPLLVEWTWPTDPQVTHARVYRRGGGLPTGWRKVAQIPVTAAPSLLDTLSDEAAALGKLLEIDNFPPVTSTFPVPADTTLGTAVLAAGWKWVTPASMTNIFVGMYVTIGANTENEEEVIVDQINPGGTQFRAYFQLTHDSFDGVYGVARYARACDIAATAFERALVAGDPENPHLLYYSKVQQPESFPPQNAVECGVPSDPIMAIIETGGQVYVPTLSTWYRLVSINGSTPVPIKTGSRHGLRAKRNWIIAEGEIYYRSHDGIYRFRGAQSDEVSKGIQWLFRNETFGPLQPMDQTQPTQLGFEKNELFFAYTDALGARKRLVYSIRDDRWRNDDRAVTAMNFEEDTARLLFGTADGNIFVDRIGEFDELGFVRAHLYVDHFSRNDGALGLKWENWNQGALGKLFGDWGIVAQQCKAIGGGPPAGNVGACFMVWNEPGISPDQSIEYKLVQSYLLASYGYDWPHIVLRNNQPRFSADFGGAGNDSYVVTPDSTYWRITNGAGTPLYFDDGVEALGPNNIKPGDIVKFELIGTELKFYVNGAVPNTFEFDDAGFPRQKPWGSLHIDNAFNVAVMPPVLTGVPGIYFAQRGKEEAAIPDGSSVGLLCVIDDVEIFGSNFDTAAVDGMQYASIPFQLQTAALDQGKPKAEKVYNELTLDIDTQGVFVTVEALFDNSVNALNLGTVKTTGRQQVQININDGKGRSSRNIALRLSGVYTTRPIHVYEAHIRALVDAEQRKSFDTYWLKYDTDEYKLLKQVWFEYKSATAPINVKLYIDDAATPEFECTLAARGRRYAQLVKVGTAQFGAIKAKMFRWVATSTEDFQIFDESHVEIKPLCGTKGYAKAKLMV